MPEVCCCAYCAFRGADEDRFIFYTDLSALANVDQIMDFEVGIDEIQLSRGIFTPLPLRTLTASEADDGILYDTTIGDL